MTTHYIQTLGVAKCREILGGAPEGATGYRHLGNKIGYAKVNHNGVYWDKFGKWKSITVCEQQSEESFIESLHSLTDLRTELSAYDTDSCTDIANHISPNTVVIENNLHEQFQEANEAECGR